MVRWLRMVAELEADARVQQMHRANVAKRQAARAARRAAMLRRMRKNQIVVYNDKRAKIEMMEMAFNALGDSEALNRAIERGNNELFDVALEVYEKRCDKKIARFRAKLGMPPAGNKVHVAAMAAA